MSAQLNRQPRPAEGILDELDDALADSFPASDPSSHSIPTRPSSPPRTENLVTNRETEQSGPARQGNGVS